MMRIYAHMQQRLLQAVLETKRSITAVSLQHLNTLSFSSSVNYVPVPVSQLEQPLKEAAAGLRAYVQAYLHSFALPYLHCLAS